MGATCEALVRLFAGNGNFLAHMRMTFALITKRRSCVVDVGRHGLGEAFFSAFRAFVMKQFARWLHQSPLILVVAYGDLRISNSSDDDDSP
jgi:hypothetical protein